eukprot:TRINITY_DN26628_c0_g1_i1.p1 TRINITY_DN26628_c0_g1~~TRINITY_DN26628_c0_g1_i1.p1  ORF type:complete len:1033 (+),score=247.08 TRINITY_DN26628_c0_g1_i1:56-3100(+)
MAAVAGLLAVAFAGFEADLRLLYHQISFIRPRGGPWMSPCSTALSRDCFGGSAVVAAHFRSLLRGAGQTVKLVGYDGTHITQFHTEGLSVNSRVWDRLDADVAFLAEPYYLTLRARREEVFTWLERTRVPVLAGNFLLDMADDGILGFRPTLQTQVLVDTGRFKVGFISIMPEATWVPTVPQDLTVPPMAKYLRRAGADVVVAICQGFEGELWERSNPVWERMAGEVDVVIPPSCVVPACDENATQYLLNGTWFLPSRASGGGIGNGRGASVEWIDFNLVGGKLEPVRAEHVSVMEPLPAALNDSAYEADAQWLESILTDANSNDPVVGYSTAPMPDAQLFAQGDSETILDDRCRRDFCPLGEMGGRATAAAFPHVDVVWAQGGFFRKGWDRGVLTKRQVYDAVPFPDFLCEFITTGPELWRTLEKFVGAVNSDGSYNHSHPLRGGFPQPYGMRYEFDPSRPVGQRVLNVTVYNKATSVWEELVRTREYRMMLPSFICDGGDQYDFYKKPKSLHHYETTMQDQVVDMILEQVNFTPAPADTYQRLNDPRPRWWLPSLQAANCSVTQRFDEQWAHCVECPLGFAQNPSHPQSCIAVSESERRGWLWAVLAVGAMVVVVGAPVGWHYSRSWRRLRHLRSANVIATNVAKSIASLRLEEVSYIKEIPNPNELQKAFAEIIRILLEYRSFLPLSLRVDDSLQRGDLRSAADLESVTSDTSLGRTIGEKRFSVSCRVVTPPDSSSERSARSEKHRTGTMSPAISEKDLVSRKVTVLWVGVQNFHKHFLPSGGPAGFSLVVDEVVGTVISCKGLLDHMSGDRFMCTFGGTRACGSQGAAAGAAALAISSSLPLAGSMGSAPFEGIDTGVCKVGTLGNTQVRKFTVIGTTVNIAFACSRMATSYRAPILVGMRFFEEMNVQLEHRARAIWETWKFSARGLYAVYQLLGTRKEQNNEEWMYQLEKCEAEDRFAGIHAAVRRRLDQGLADRLLPTPISGEPEDSFKDEDVLDPTKVSHLGTAF